MRRLPVITYSLSGLVGMLAFVLIMAGCGGPERTYYRGGNSYLPLLEGRVLRYEEQQEGKTRAYTITMQYAGGHMTKVFPLRIKGIDLGECTLLSRDSTVIFSTNDPYLAMIPRATLPEYREMWVDAAARPGANWLEEDTGVRTTFTGPERVEVPAGTFDNCYKTVSEAQQELFDSLIVRRDRGDLSVANYERELERARQVITRWFAPGVGLVKEQIGNKILRALVKVEKEGVGVADTSKTDQYEIIE